MKNNKQYFIKCSEFLTYEIAVDAINEDQAIEKAKEKLTNDPSEYFLGADGFQCDSVEEL